MWYVIYNNYIWSIGVIQLHFCLKWKYKPHFQNSNFVYSEGILCDRKLIKTKLFRLRYYNHLIQYISECNHYIIDVIVTRAGVMMIGKNSICVSLPEFIELRRHLDIADAILNTLLPCTVIIVAALMIAYRLVCIDINVFLFNSD